MDIIIPVTLTPLHCEQSPKGAFVLGVKSMIDAAAGTGAVIHRGYTRDSKGWVSVESDTIIIILQRLPAEV